MSACHPLVLKFSSPAFEDGGPLPSILGWVTVRKYIFRTDAELAKTHLDYIGYDARIIADEGGGVWGPHTGISFALLVKTEDFTRAKKLIDQN